MPLGVGGKANFSVAIKLPDHLDPTSTTLSMDGPAAASLELSMPNFQKTQSGNSSNAYLNSWNITGSVTFKEDGPILYTDSVANVHIHLQAVSTINGITDNVSLDITDAAVIQVSPSGVITLSIDPVASVAI